MSKDFYSKEKRKEYNQQYYENMPIGQKKKYQYNRRKKYHECRDVADRLKMRSRERYKKKKMAAATLPSGNSPKI